MQLNKVIEFIKKHGMISSGETVLAAVSGGEFRYSPDCRTAELTAPAGTTVQVAQGSIGAVVNNRIRSMDCEAVLREGELYISASWYLRQICGMQVSVCADGMYATDHDAALSIHMTRLLRDLLKG